MSTRPVRSNRGQRRYLTEEQLKKDDQFYKNIFGKSNQENEEQEFVQSKPIGVIRTQMFRSNILQFPFARSHHYFYKLDTLNRLGNSTYVEDPNKSIYHFKDKHLYQQYKKRGFRQKNVINRQYITLPYHRTWQTRKKQGDKNPCLQYLFLNQDRKLKIDQLLYELRYLQKHHILLKQGKVKNFTAIKKELQLAPLIVATVSQEDKIFLLNKKIEQLQMRKAKMEIQFEAQDKIFFKSALNQKFFNQKLQLQSELNLQNIHREADYLFSYQNIIYGQISQQQISKVLKQFFAVYSTISRIHPALQEQINDFQLNHLKLGHLLPAYILNFTQSQNFIKTQQILSIRMLQLHGDTFFYILKSFWKRIFSRDLVFEKEFIAQKKQDYFSKFQNSITHYQSICVLADQNLKLPQSSKQNPLYMCSKSKKISHKDFVLIYLIYYIYERVGYFNIDYKLIGDESFSKYNYTLMQRINIPHAGNLDLAIKKCIQLFITMAIYENQEVMHIRWQFTNNIGLIWLTENTGAQEQENEDSEQQQQQQQQQQEIIEGASPNKKVKY